MPTCLQLDYLGSNLDERFTQIAGPLSSDIEKERRVLPSLDSSSYMRIIVSFGLLMIPNAFLLLECSSRHTVSTPDLYRE